MRKQFDRQLEQLHVELIKMGSLCEQAIALSAEALKNEEEGLIKQVFLLDGEIDQKEHDVENLCMRLFLKQQPVARDLRTISAALRMISDMERIGDQAGDIAELAPNLAGSTLLQKVPIHEMAFSAVKMVTDSVDAFVREDLEMAYRIIREDDKVDALFVKVREQLTQLIFQGDEDAGMSIDLLMAAKYFERIADHAVNIAEWVEYSITGIHQNNEHQPGE